MFDFNTTDGKHFQISERTTIDDQYTSSSVARSSIGKTEADGGCILWHCSHHNMRFRFSRRSLSVVARNLHLVNYLCSYQPKIPKIPDVSPSGIKNPPQAEVLCWSFWPSIWAQDSRWSEGVRQNIAWNRSFEDSRSLFSGFCSKLGHFASWVQNDPKSQLAVPNKFFTQLWTLLLKVGSKAWGWLRMVMIDLQHFRGHVAGLLKNEVLCLSCPQHLWEDQFE